MPPYFEISSFVRKQFLKLSTHLQIICFNAQPPQKRKIYWPSSPFDQRRVDAYALEGNFRFFQDKSDLKSASDKKFVRKATVALENKICVLDFQNEALTYAIKPFDRRYETADLPYQSSTYDIKPLVLDVQNEPPTYDIKLFELNRQYRKYQTANLPYQAAINDIKPIVLDFQNEALAHDIKPFDWKYEAAHLPYEAPTYDIKPFELNRKY